MKNISIIILVLSVCFSSQGYSEKSYESSFNEFNIDLTNHVIKLEQSEIENRLSQIILEASKKGVNAIVLAFQKGDNELAEMLLQMRQNDLEQGYPTFDFPGYGFKRHWKGGYLSIWLKPAPVMYRNQWGGTRYFYHNKIDVDSIKILMKYDTENLWYYNLGKMVRHAYWQCDLEGFLFLWQIVLLGEPKVPHDARFQQEYQGAKNMIGQAIAVPPRYLVDPFLSNFPVDLENINHFNAYAVKGLPSIWDFRPDDNEIVRSLKQQIQKLVWDALLWEDNMLKPE